MNADRSNHSSRILSIKGVSKSFDGVQALKNVSFDVYSEECLAIVGENGAGKSTLMKILSGVWPHGTFSGEIFFEGNALVLKSTLDARNLRIAIIHQELCLFPHLTVTENLFLTSSTSAAPATSLWQKVSWTEMRKQAADLLESLKFSVNPDATIETLSVAERQLVEIARAFHYRSKLLILDEPTSALSQAEVEQLFRVIQRMKKTMTFIYISHKLDEVFALADRIVVLRDGASVADVEPKSVTKNDIIRHMVGRTVTLTARPTHSVGKEILEVRDLTHRLPSGANVLEGVHFKLREGEVLGVAGLMGSGRSALLRSLVGVLPGERKGQIQFEGKNTVWKGIAEALEAGVAFVPEDRKKEGLLLDQSIGFNITLSTLDHFLNLAGFLKTSEIEKEAEIFSREMGVKFQSVKNPVRNLSGGNQQKVLLGKMVAVKPKILLLDEPTRGIDVGAKEEIYEIIHRLAFQGLAIIVVSSELPELLSLCDRIVVLRQGCFAGDLINVCLTQESVMALAAGA